MKYYSLFPSKDKWEETYKNVNLKKEKLSIGWAKKNIIGQSEAMLREYLQEEYSLDSLSLTNATKALIYFQKLLPGDIVFVRGDASIIGVAIVITNPFYSEESLLASGDHNLQVACRFLFPNTFSRLTLSAHKTDLDELARHEVIFKENRSLALKSISGQTAVAIFRHILDTD